MVRAVESVRGECWDDFMGRHGDYGRDLALHIGRLKCGLTLRELGKEAGAMSVPSVAKACERMLKRLKTDRTMQRVSAKVIKKLNRIEAKLSNVKLQPLSMAQEVIDSAPVNQ